MNNKENSHSENKLITSSPCVGVCSTTFGDDVCYGCQRTYKEVINWNTYSDHEKDKVNRRLAKNTKE